MLFHFCWRRSQLIGPYADVCTLGKYVRCTFIRYDDFEVIIDCRVRSVRPWGSVHPSEFVSNWPCLVRRATLSLYNDLTGSELGGTRCVHPSVGAHIGVVNLGPLVVCAFDFEDRSLCTCRFSGCICPGYRVCSASLCSSCPVCFNSVRDINSCAGSRRSIVETRVVKGDCERPVYMFTCWVGHALPDFERKISFSVVDITIRPCTGVQC